MLEKYEVTKEAILAMAEKSPDAKEVLKAGFPEAFVDDKYFDLVALKGDHTLFTDKEARRAGFRDSLFMQVRGIGCCKGKAFILDDSYQEWTLVRDDFDQLCLTVERK